MCSWARLFLVVSVLSGVSVSPVLASDVDLLEEQASEAYDGGDVEKALTLWLKAAHLGAVDAMVVVAGLYDTGEAGEINRELARVWYEKGARQGEPLAMIRLAQLILNDSASDPHTLKNEGLQWLEKSASLGHPFAHELLEYYR